MGSGTKKTAVIAMLGIMMCSVSVKAEESENWIPVFDDALSQATEISPVEVELGFTLANMYLWRGQKLGSDTSWMPYVTVSPDFEPLGNASFTYWADMTQHVEGDDNLEMDFVFDYTVEMMDLLALCCYDQNAAPEWANLLLDLSLSAGYINYYFPPTQDDSHEVYGSITFNKIPLNPSMAIYNDFGQGSGVWLEWGVSHAFDLKYFMLNVYSILGYNHRQWGKTSALSTIVYGASIPVPLGAHMKIEPFLSYSQRLERTFTDDDTDLVHDEWYGGFNYSISF
ncbi:MAG: hypothetical protein C4541_08845 [Candidatus Auribacter fodinae]|jgi:hypothetical protein|uniref:Transporter n=1 Tax=Candidatus Auribacter fodinae TaxID=2093366 RepID=A0A3A4R124_9BACT|nr:MAG: hypothetical protein C4541_08845 [Candidatus Auribacter fodinae]